MGTMDDICDKLPSSKMLEESAKQEVPSDAGNSAQTAVMGSPSEEEVRLLALRLVVSGDLALESKGNDHVVVVNDASASRTRLSLAAFRFLRMFESPRRIGEALPIQSLAGILPTVRVFIDRHILVDADAPKVESVPKLRVATAYKFCSAPAYVKPIVPHFVILGAPYDLSEDIESRLVPDLIRRKSLDYSYLLGFNDGRPRGWFDANRSLWILRGATIADAGDVRIDFGENQARFLGRMADALDECCVGQTVPVVLGGDRLVTRAAVGWLCSRQTLTVVQITCEQEPSAGEGAGLEMLRFAGVERVVRLGMLHGIRNHSRRVNLWECSAATVRDLGPERVANTWGENAAVYLSVNMSVTARDCMKSAGNSPSDRLTFHEIGALIAAIGNIHRIVGLDLVGLDMASELSALKATLGCQLALAGMSAAYDRF